jgi:hypothetical protein
MPTQMLATFRFDPDSERIMHTYYGTGISELPDSLLPVLIGSLETMKLDVYREYAARCDAAE